MNGEFRLVRFVCSGRVDLFVRLKLFDSAEFVVTSQDPLDPAVLRFLAGGIRQALVDSERFPKGASILAYENHGEGDNWGAMFTTAKAATNHALGLDHLLPLVLHAPEP